MIIEEKTDLTQIIKDKEEAFKEETLKTEKEVKMVIMSKLIFKKSNIFSKGYKKNPRFEIVEPTKRNIRDVGK